MASFRLTATARRDLGEIRRHIQREASVRMADHVEEKIFAAMRELVKLPQIGHRRPGLGDGRDLFHIVFEYAIVFRRDPQVVILRVVHGARDLPKLI